MQVCGIHPSSAHGTMKMSDILYYSAGSQPDPRIFGSAF